MGSIKQFRDPRFSLLQSAVDEVVARRGGLAARPDLDNPFVEAVAELAGRLESGHPVPQPGAALGGDVGLGDAILQCARLAMLLAEAKASGRAREAQRYQEELDVESGACDSDWMEIAEAYGRGLVLHLGEVPYRRHARMEDFVIPDRLPANARVALVSGWGSGLAGARILMEQIGRRSPDVLIHLGDIYYSGTAFEVENYFLTPLRAAVDPGRTACFSLAGNHDMYSGGRAYYEALLPAFQQPASYFCLRNEHWQFVALDTGLHDRIPGGGTTFLEARELDWAADKIRNAGGRQTVLLSHHQLFSACERIGDRYYNERLYGQVAPLLDSVAAWFWGHEHRLAVYEEFDLLRPGLRRGRSIGCGGFPAEDGAAELFPQVRVNPAAQLGRGEHAYALMELEGASARISYFHTGDERAPLFQEEIASSAAAGRGRPAS